MLPLYGSCCLCILTSDLCTSYSFRFLATCDSFTSIGFSYRIHKSTVSKIVDETCSAIWQILQPKMMPTPTAEFWKQVAAEYESHWQFPNCVGSIDGKHILI